MRMPYWLAVVLVLGYGAADLTATELSQSAPFSSSKSQESFNLLFAQFNDQGGTLILQEVKLRLELTGQINLAVENTGENPAEVYACLTGFARANTGALGLTAAVSCTTAACNLAAADGAFGSGTDCYNFGQMCTPTSTVFALAPELNPFKGSGTITAELFCARGFALEGLESYNVAATSGRLFGQATLTYVFVPEPTASAIFIMGLMIVRRFRVLMQHKPN